MFHLHKLNNVVGTDHDNLVDLLSRGFIDNTSHQSLSPPQYSPHKKVLHALQRLLLTWNDVKLLTNFQPLLKNAGIDTSILDPSTAFLMVTMESRLTTNNRQCRHHSDHCRLCIDIVYQTMSLETPSRHKSTNRPSITRVRSFGFMSKNDHIPSYIFPLLINVLKWWHGKVVFVLAPGTDQSIKLKLLYIQYITMYADAQKTHFESFFSVQNTNRQLQTIITNTIQSLRLNIKSQIIFQSLETQDIRGRDVSSFLVALASLSTLPWTTTNPSLTAVYRCRPKYHLYHLDMFVIEIICTYLQNNCIYNAVYDFLHTNRNFSCAFQQDSDCHSGCLAFNPSRYRLKTHYYDDLIF